ncbi:DUF4112 domain-containing protein [Vannielia litorea]|uniref:DUF4112 domain-containing protein n=1 Tax=Vannielia litorea TaxID=1217970 RepID=A0A1N6FM81_9RHOB|nr:DUF4112 domain-containing protein [Vannielia litorea]SIN96372.1 protein of unknown function [Vannielia litorea]
MTAPTSLTGPPVDAEIAALHRLARRMDALFRIPGTQVDIGLDTLLGLVPVVGDTLAAAPSAWIIFKAHRLGATPGALAQMALNTALDWSIGSIPLVGDIFDAAFNANIRNVTLLEKNLASQAARAREVGPRRLNPRASGAPAP